MTRALPRLAAVFLLVIPVWHAGAVTVAAQDLITPAVLATLRAADVSPAIQSLAPAASEKALPARGKQEFSSMTRPAVLPALYVATAVTQALDAHSTMTALHAGAQEANPFMRTATSSPGAFLAIKAGAAAGTILLAEKMWPRNRAGAIATMVALNSVTCIIAAHNYAVAGRLR